MKAAGILASAPSSAGKSHLQKHLAGKRLTQRQAILAKCCDCMGFYVDGRRDCRVPACPLFPWRPYRSEIDSEAVGPHQEGLVARQVASDGRGETP